ncbi:MAG: ABC transporter ATP-binding protein [Peptococcaceae bacterium]|jgi:oligopeptide/dipeptide ABC transporter ATP-binding protein|nr:ABC transporter ATP-binding protein [Peptococcaceae bacterium]
MTATETTAKTLLSVRQLKKYFPIGGGMLKKAKSNVHAVDDVTLDVYAGQTLGLVGESGCGKTTMGRLALKLLPKTSGEVFFQGKDIYQYSGEQEKEFRTKAQLIFQDSFSSFDNRDKIGSIIGEPLVVHNVCRGSELDDRVGELLRTVGLKPELAAEFPHTLAAGQKQCVGIARAIALKPDFIVCDEPISALDVSVRAMVLNLLKDLQSSQQLTYMFISHDIRVVRWLSSHIAVMYVGKLVEYGETEEIFAHRLHPYTEALLCAVPIENPRDRHIKREILLGEVPSPVDPPPGCRFAARCKLATERCSKEDPPLLERRPGHWVSCFEDFEGESEIS